VPKGNEKKESNQRSEGRVSAKVPGRTHLSTIGDCCLKRTREGDRVPQHLTDKLRDTIGLE
jgi:hypothetical protein